MALAPGTLAHRVLSSPLAAALTWPHGVDRYLAAIDPAWSLTETYGTVTEVRHQTADTVTLRVAPNGNWLGHRAGQYVELGVEIDGRTHTRCYSITTSARAPRTDDIELTLKAHADGLVSRHLADRATPGLRLRLGQAIGDFTLPATDALADELILISGGSGITPVLGMLRTLVDDDAPVTVTFVHYSLGAADQLYRAELDALAARTAARGGRLAVRIVRGHVDDDDADLAGPFTPAHLDDVAPRWRDDAQLFVCGPTPLMDAVADAVAEVGGTDRLFTEAFQTTFAPVDPDAADATGTLHLAASGREIANDGSSILAQAEAAGLAPAHGCRMGICHTCTRTKTAGCHRDLITGEVSGPDAEEIRICVSAPVGDVVVDL